LCPRCGNIAAFGPTGSNIITWNYSLYSQRSGGARVPDYFDRVIVLKCQHCKQGVAVVEEKWVGDHPARHGLGSGGDVTHRGIMWWPPPDYGLSEDVPDAIADVYLESLRAHMAGCYRAAAVMARRTLEAVTADQGESDGRLVDRLERMAAGHKLLPTLADWATELRLVGNVGAHFDAMNDVSKDDAAALLGFLRELMKYLYELPAQLARRRGG